MSKDFVTRDLRCPRDVQRRLRGARTAAFDYFADRNGVYWGGKLVKGAHRGSFVVEGYSNARDRSRRYSENTPLGANAPSPRAGSRLRRALLPFRIPSIVASEIRQFRREMPEPMPQPRPDRGVCRRESVRDQPRFRA